MEKKERVFIVEDEIVIVRSLEQAMRQFGYTVCGFSFTGEEALELVEKEKPDLVLIDIYLRGRMDGIELAEEITTRFEVPVIYITAYSTKDLLDRAKKTDPYGGYIVKPIRDSQLKVTVELALERFRAEKKRRAEILEYLRTIEELDGQLHECTREMEDLAEKHQQDRQEIGQYREKVDGLRDELLKVNKVLMALTRQIEKTRAEIELEIAAAIRVRIMPILRQLESDPGLEKCRTELGMLQLHLHQLSSGLSKESTWCTDLSATELRIATLIQNGCTSEEIALRLHVSLDTVKTHRKRIRRKLNLHNTFTNLSTFLRAQAKRSISG